VDVLFSYRGSILAVPALLALLSATLTPQSFVSALPLLLLGLMLRFWAVGHIGGESRTRLAEAPESRVVTGPYRFFRHPLYLGNLGVALGLLLALRPPGPIVALIAFFTIAFYALLARREDEMLWSVPTRKLKRRASWEEIARCERSTWLTTALILTLGAFRSLV
jgi:protein-S-isoprenylcysteine O-methyltransferase Ste14